LSIPLIYKTQNRPAAAEQKCFFPLDSDVFSCFCPQFCFSFPRSFDQKEKPAWIVAGFSLLIIRM
jgi:hypothetical protein